MIKYLFNSDAEGELTITGIPDDVDNSAIMLAIESVVVARETERQNDALHALREKAMREDGLLTDDYCDCFGLCPTCHKTDGFFNNGPDHHFYCETHQTRWYVGSNLFSSWREETPESRQFIKGRFEAFRAVKEFY
jgi:hypothetical protein